MSQAVLIIGATSTIAEAVAGLYAQRGARLFLVARNIDKLKAIKTKLMTIGAKDVRTLVMDANDHILIPQVLDAAWKALGRVDVALVAHGTLPDQQRTETDIDYEIKEFRNNAESVITCLASLALRFETQSMGVIAVISSVAADRGRADNYLYGTAKAAIDTYASGLRAKLFKKNVHVLTIKPGFVATHMTEGLDLPKRWTAKPDSVAKDILKAISKRQNVLYTPWFWRFIMLMIRWMPEAVFKRLNF